MLLALILLSARRESLACFLHEWKVNTNWANLDNTYFLTCLNDYTPSFSNHGFLFWFRDHRSRERDWWHLKIQQNHSVLSSSNPVAQTEMPHRVDIRNREPLLSCNATTLLQRPAAFSYSPHTCWQMAIWVLRGENQKENANTCINFNDSDKRAQWHALKGNFHSYQSELKVQAVSLGVCVRW